VRDKLYLIGYPLGHSLSPQMHNAQFAKIKLPLTYAERAIPPGNFTENLRAMFTEPDFLGANATQPYKQQVVPFLDQLEGDAQDLRAVNTILKRADGRLVGYNTDAQGFSDALVAKLKAPVKRALIIGSGGAAMAVLWGLAGLGCERFIVVHRSERNVGEIMRIAGLMNKRVRLVKLAHFEDFFKWADEEHIFADPQGLDVQLAEGVQAPGSATYNIDSEFDKGPRHYDVLVNATPVGLMPNAKGAIGDHPKFLRLFTVVFDLVYNPLETRLLFLAKMSGCETVSGREMLERQAELSRRIWVREYKSQLKQ
jgi:shikimate dehydrogenase